MIPGTGAVRLVDAVLRCYPARWRRRHGDEAAELAALLMRDGTPAASIALSYLAGAARERLTPHPRGRLAGRMSAVMCMLLVAACSLGISVGLLTSSAPARAASTTHAGERAHCRPVPMATVRLKNSTSDHPQLKIREPGGNGHGRSC